MTPVYVLKHSICGHTAGVCRDRAQLLAWKNKLTIQGHKGWRIEESDLEAIDTELLQLVDGERCALCTVDGNTREVLR